MTYAVLLGAGFSRNCGGWLASEAFEYLLGCPEVVSSVQLRDLLWKHQESGAGFEGALEELQTAYVREPHSNSTRLMALQSAIRQMMFIGTSWGECLDVGIRMIVAENLG